MKKIVALSLLVLAPGCATIMEGSSQSVTVTTDPAGANCTVDRAGQHIGQVFPTPGSIHLDKSKNDLSVTCSHDGYQTATVAQSPKFQGTTFGNIVAGGLIGVAIDAASGANFQYPSEVKVLMAPMQSPVASVPTSVPVRPASATTPASPERTTGLPRS